MVLALASSWLGPLPPGADALLEALRRLGLHHAALYGPGALPDADTFLARFRAPGARLVALDAASYLERGRAAVSALAASNEAEREAAVAAVAALGRAAARFGAPHVVLRFAPLRLPKVERREDEWWSHLRLEGASDGVRARAEAMWSEAEQQAEAFLDWLCRSLFRLARVVPEVSFAVATGETPARPPTPRMLAWLLEDLRDPRIGYWHDAAAAHLLESMGLCEAFAHLVAAGARTLGTDLHDVQGAEVGLPPGCGEIDFGRLARELPRRAPGVLALDPRSGEGEARMAVDLLAGAGFALR